MHDRHLKLRLPFYGGLFLCALLLIGWQSALAGWFFKSQSTDKVSAKVEKVVDGDTLYLIDGTKVRLIGINAFEIRGPAAKYARTAKKTLRDLVENKKIQLQPGRERRDKYGRLLAHVFIAERNVQEYLLRQGLAVVVGIPPNVEYIAQYKQAELAAKQQKRGIWAKPESWIVDIQTDAGRREVQQRRGFIYVRGKVQAVEQSRRNFRLMLNDKFSVTINKEHFEQYFDLSLNRLAGKTITARGWLTQFKGRRYVKIRHSAMLDVEN